MYINAQWNRLGYRGEWNSNIHSISEDQCKPIMIRLSSLELANKGMGRPKPVWVKDLSFLKKELVSLSPDGYEQGSTFFFF